MMDEMKSLVIGSWIDENRTKDQFSISRLRLRCIGFECLQTSYSNIVLKSKNFKT